MTVPTITNKRPLTRLARTLLAGLTGSAAYAGCIVSGLAEPLSLNYDTLSFFEEPLAVDIGGATVNHNHLIDVSAARNFTDEDSEVKLRGSLEVAAETQLPNALTVGATFHGSYSIGEERSFEERFGVSVGGVWGTVAAGDVTGMVRENTRRMRGTGNAALAGDDALGGLEETGVAYRGRYSAFTVTGAADRDGNFDVGVAYERPSRYVDHRITARYTRGEYRSEDGRDHMKTDAIGVVGEIIRGRLLVDLGVGYEHLDGAIVDADRYSVSTGLNYKVGQLTASAEGHLESIDGDEVYSLAAGSRYDIARGLSVNLGYNFRSSPGLVDGIGLLPGKASEVIVSGRYEY